MVVIGGAPMLVGRVVAVVVGGSGAWWAQEQYRAERAALVAWRHGSGALPRPVGLRRKSGSGLSVGLCRVSCVVCGVSVTSKRWYERLRRDGPVRSWSSLRACLPETCPPSPYPPPLAAPLCAWLAVW